MKKSILLSVALLALAACQTTASRDGERFNYRCDAGKELSYRNVPGAIEVYASGVTNRLEPVAGAPGQWHSADGSVVFTETGGNASLTGVYDGPYQNCHRKLSNWWFRLW